ncbi:MAG: aminodeoxychorismate/anthranilate synthase component II [Clostridiales bacterium]|jgi:anthranilate synthase component 2|nr:aminodeoxychorismate/anthranilate synthase component II [Clostridiales bacterium]
MVLLIDNYDSFSYNLYQLIGGLTADIKVVRNDEMTVDEIRGLGASHIFISPGPGRPADAGVCIDVIRQLGGTTPILGICLGHQAICEAFGGVVGYAKELVHGKDHEVQVNTNHPIFEGLPAVIRAARYHSLAVEEASLPKELQVIAREKGGEVMAIAHTSHNIAGVQFHPESILTPLGPKIIENFYMLGK